jgi:PIN domain nuclease of toxin-antitoxin system
LNLLLDTHILLWSLSEPAKLSPIQKAAIEAPSNVVWVSSLTIWEINIKAQVGKLTIPTTLRESMLRLGVKSLPFSLDHAQAISTLPLIHHDPFDRGLIAQAKVEHFHLVTQDKAVLLYGQVVELLHA